MPPAPPALTIFCGSSMRSPVEVLIRSARDRGQPVRLDLGGSETLLPRVLAGERADLLVTHEPFATRLAKAGKVQRSVPIGVLIPVLAVPRGNPRRLHTLADLSQPGLRVGLPDARYSTCGAYVRERLSALGLAEAVQARVVVEQRSHQELATALRLGSLDAAVVWNFIAVENAAHLTVLPLEGPWPTTPVVLCVLPGASPAIDDLLSSTDLPALFSRHGFGPNLPSPSTDILP